MKKLTICALVLCLVAFLTAPALAEVTLNESQPFDTVVWVACANGGAGEEVELSGELHVLITSTVNDNMVQMKTHFQPQGVSGVGLTTGAKYHGTGVTQDNIIIHNASFPSETTFVNNFRIIGQGKGNNFLIHENIHVTVDANGETTAEVENVRSECK